jgi:hypothetical protein
MANKIQIKRTSTYNATDVSSLTLAYGELAWSNGNNKLYIGKLGSDNSTVSTTELNALIVGSYTSASSAELNILDGATVTTAELNILDGVTSTAAELNILDGVTATASELNKTDGLTASTAELNKLDGVTATTAELNYVDTTAGTAVASKAVVLDSNKDITGIRNMTLAGNLTVSGTTTTVNSTVVSIGDNFLELGSDIETQGTEAAAVDVGFFFPRDNDSGGSDLYVYDGLAYDGSAGKWFLFKGTQGKPGAADINVNALAKSHKLCANLEGISSSIHNTIDRYDIDCGTFS